MIVNEVGFVSLFRTTTELLFEVFSQHYERGSVMVPTNLPFNELTEGFGSERLTGALLYRLTHHVHILFLIIEPRALHAVPPGYRAIHDSVRKA